MRSVFIFFIVFIGHLSLENNSSLLGPALSQPGQAQQQVLGWLLLRSLGDGSRRSNTPGSLVSILNLLSAVRLPTVNGRYLLASAHPPNEFNIIEICSSCLIG